MITYESILQRMQVKFFELAGYEADDASDIGIRLKVLAGEIFSLSAGIDWLTRQVFPQTATGEKLELLAEERGLTRKKAVSSLGSLTFLRPAPLSYDVPIPAGSVCSTTGTPGVRFITVQDTVLKAGQCSVTVPAQSEVGGRQANASAQTVTVLVTPPAGIASVTNAAPFIGGTDAETDEELRARLLASYRSVSNGSNAAFYRETVLQYDGVYSVSVLPRAQGPGTIDIYAAGKGTLLPDSLMAQIGKTLNELREINVSVRVLPPELFSVGIYLSVKPVAGANMGTARAACEQSIKDYFSGLSIGEPVLLAAVGNAVYNTPGVQNYAFVTDMCWDTKLKSTQLAVPGEIGIAEMTVGTV